MAMQTMTNLIKNKMVKRDTGKKVIINKRKIFSNFIKKLNK